MPKGTLKVQLVGAEGIKDPEIFGTSDPYALLWVGSKPAVKSFTARDHGTRPVWNQHFTFELGEHDKELRIRILNENRLSAHDVIGAATGKLPVQDFSVIRPSGKAQGVVKVGLTFSYKNGPSYPPAAQGPGAGASRLPWTALSLSPTCTCLPSSSRSWWCCLSRPPPQLQQGDSYPAAAYPHHPAAYPGPPPGTAAPPYQAPAPYPQPPSSYPPHDQAQAQAHHQAGGDPAQAGSHSQYPFAPGSGESQYPSAPGYAPAPAQAPASYIYSFIYPAAKQGHYTPAGYPAAGASERGKYKEGKEGKEKKKDKKGKDWKGMKGGQASEAPAPQQEQESLITSIVTTGLEITVGILEVASAIMSN